MTKSKQNGFTLIELVVSIAIIAILTVVTMTAFRQGNKDRSVQLGTDLIVSAIRTAQNDSLNPQVLQTATCSDKTATEYHVFLDLNNPTNISVLAYDQCNDPAITVQSVNLPANTQLKASGLSIDGNSAGVSGRVDIKFMPPFAKITSALNGGTFNAFSTVNIVIESSDHNIFRTVVLSGVSGRVDVQ